MRSIVYHQFRRNCISSKRSFVYHQADSFLYTPMVWWDTTRQCRVDDIHAKAWWYTKPVGLDKKTLVQKNESFLVAEAGLSSPAIEQSTGLFSQSLCSFYSQTLEVVSSPTKTKRNPETNLKVSFGILVAEAGLEPTTFGLWARRATNCSTPRWKLIKKVVERVGFEPTKRNAADLQSAPFSHSGTSPFGAGNRTWTHNLLITSQLLYQLSYAST